MKAVISSEQNRNYF